MSRVEINEWMWSGCVDPDRTENPDVHGAHEVLAEEIQAVGCFVVSGGLESVLCIKGAKRGGRKSER